jgi:hypothetical protein
MPNPPQGSGDMYKSTYDPDNNGLIAVSQLEMTLGTIAEGQGLGIASQEITTPVSGAKTNHGAYTGDSTANRAIAHGLGVIPRLVLIMRVNYWYRLFRGYDYILHQAIVAGTEGALDVTAMDATNFYVGNATSYAQSANLDLTAYYWVAIGD